MKHLKLARVGPLLAFCLFSAWVSVPAANAQRASGFVDDREQLESQRIKIEGLVTPAGSRPSTDSQPVRRNKSRTKPQSQSPSAVADQMLTFHGFDDEPEQRGQVSQAADTQPISFPGKTIDTVGYFAPIIGHTSCDCDGAHLASCGVESSCDGCPDCYSGSQYLPGQVGRFRDLRNFSIRYEALVWWMNGFDVPPLLTTSSAGTSLNDAGVLGLGTTRVIAGNEQMPDSDRSGGRFTFDYWLDPQQTRGFEVIYTGLETETSVSEFDSQQFPILARPFFNIESGVTAQDSELIAFPGQLVGDATITAKSQLQGVEVLFRRAIRRNCGLEVDLVLGWRHNQLDESLRFADHKRVTGTALGLPIGTTLSEVDQFETENRFDGFQLGFMTKRCHLRWTLESVAKIALGNNHSLSRISGNAKFQELSSPPVTTLSNVGLLAQSTNIGDHTSDDFAVIPELGVTLGYALSDRLQATLGYTFMYWSRVARPGDQVDESLNLTQLDPGGLVGAARPSSPVALTDLWTQGLRFGLDLSF
ncbi:hypothetical protein Pla52n_25450 [Stieleria varia]|uniref:Uncharacterized protein n=2 Tax=Stieleria varia TaxID=2528005 RepID=A0A5C6B284_9BACT|nr:hypothetical protein Pla52n_25450 [Stieleria varia]